MSLAVEILCAVGLVALLWWLFFVPPGVFTKPWR